MGNVAFQAPRQVSGYRSTLLHTVQSWMPAVVTHCLNDCIISYPRPIAERTFTHTPNDKWLTTVPWSCSLGVMFGAFPFRIVAIRGDLTDSDFTIDQPKLTITRTFNTPGTYRFTVYVSDSLVAFPNGQLPNIAFVLTIWNKTDASILNEFRVIDFSAGSNGTGTVDSPYNAWSSFWGTDWNVAIPETIIMLMKGTGTVTNPQLTLANENNPLSWDIGTNRPRTLIGVIGSNVTIDMSPVSPGVGKRLNSFTNVGDYTVKGFTLSGNASDATFGSSMIRQSLFGNRCAFHQLTLKNAIIADYKSKNHGVIGSDGPTDEYHTWMDITIQDCISIYKSNVARWFEVTHHLVARWTLLNISNGGVNRFAVGITHKHDSHFCEMREVTWVCNGYSPLEDNRSATAGMMGWTDVFPLIYERNVMRYNYLVTTGRAFYTSNDKNHQYIDCVCIHNTARCDQNTLFTPGASSDVAGVPPYRTLPGSTAWISKNIVEGGQPFNKGWGGTTSGNFSVNMSPIAGKPSIEDDNLQGANGTMFDSNGVPLSAANYGYGHYIP